MGFHLEIEHEAEGEDHDRWQYELWLRVSPFISTRHPGLTSHH